MDITATQVKAFIHCPYYSRFLYNNTPLLRIQAKDHWHNCQRASILDFCKRWVRDSKMPSLQELQDLWHRHWFDDPMSLTYSERQISRDAMGVDGWYNLLRFHRFCSENYTNILSVEMPYKIPIAGSEHTMSGSIDLLLGGGQEPVIAVNFVKGNYHADRMFGANNIEMTAWRRALRMMMPTDKEPNLLYYMLQKPGGIKQTKRYQNQEAVLDEAVQSVIKSIEANNYWPIYGNKCLACDYMKLCNKGNWVD